MRTDFLKVGDILLYKGTAFTSRLIEWGTQSSYSHVGVAVDPKTFLSIESNTGHQAGVRALDLRKLADHTLDVFRVKPPFSFDSDKVISFLVDHLGAGFDWLGVSWLGVLKGASLLTGFKFQPYNQFQKNKDYFCSELCYEAFQTGGLDIVPQVSEADITSPADIARSERLEKITP